MESKPNQDELLALLGYDRESSEGTSLESPKGPGGTFGQIEVHKDLRAIKGGLHVVSIRTSSISPSGRSLDFLSSSSSDAILNLVEQFLLHSKVSFFSTDDSTGSRDNFTLGSPPDETVSVSWTYF